MEASQSIVLPDLDSKRGESFRYRALDASRREIRLLKILPPGTTQGEEEQGNIRCTVEYTSLDDRPEYSALSYAWGSPEEPIPILVDDSICYVTENLEVALRHLQTMEIGFLWVDAVCINQKDDAEKSSQVQMMGSIFKEATQVIVWLGPERDESESAMKLLEKLGSRETELSIFGQQVRRPDDPAWLREIKTRILELLHGFELAASDSPD